MRTLVLLLTSALGVVGITLVASLTGTDATGGEADEADEAVAALPTPPRVAPPYLFAETGPPEPDRERDEGRDGQPDPLDELDTTVDVEDWERLADCESGEWDRNGEPKPDTARWDYGLDFDHGDHFQGGLNFHPNTWDAYRDPDMPAHAGRATQVEEIVIAERVLDDQGWDAWPVCSEKMDLAV